MTRDIIILVVGSLLGFFGNMALSAFTVYRRLDQVLLTMATKEQMTAAITEARHALRNEMQAFVGDIEGDIVKRLDGLDGRVRDLERKG